ncbi:CDP-alcohol phosphatidyltransferase family protein [Mycetocola manganoxydans]|uniref:CDP-alcohol phosphatidyltransferase family protein n=1 Tax=Mycetocola manganoxydans TaxID=699879 RepID=UPI0019CED302|nr:CDP-alcohol phosphatidyltransferase family protein [Mycetocola manganoxydans]GHD45396.1 CDP-alcohol phosphatidyltransferase [Mycetocola manganoxydans]
MTTFRSALTELSSAQKSKKGVSLYSRFVNRPLGRVLAAALHQAGVGPNQVTLLSAFSTGAGLAVLVSQEATFLTGVVVAALLVLGFALDSADGQVARLSGRSSPAGEWLDHVVDAAKMVAVHACVLVAAWFHAPHQAGWLVIPLAFQLVATVMFAGGTLVELLTRSLPAGNPHLGTASPLRAVALLPADYGVLALCFLLWGTPVVFQTAYATLFVANAIILVLLLAKWFRELRSV